jgi:3-oxoadipate enol-lactonase
MARQEDPALRFAKVNGVTIHHQVLGAAGKPPIVFINSLGTDFRIWRDVIVRLAGDFAVLCYDKRGHGLSGLGPKNEIAIEDHADDLIALLEELRFGKALICGLSIGGLIAQSLFEKRPDLIRGLILCDTAHKIGTDDFWNERIAAVEDKGIEPIADGVMQRWFAPGFRATVECEGYRTMLVRQSVAGYVASCAAIRDADFTETAKRIDVPAVVVVGEHDGSTPPALCADFARLIPGARFEIVKDAAHIVPVEQPAILNEIIRAFAALTKQGAMADVATRH